MRTETAEVPETTTFQRSYQGTILYVRRVRADLAPIVDGCPVADDVILLASELSANAAQHSKSREPGGEFTVRVEMRPSDYVWLEVVDQGGAWIAPQHTDDHPHGLDLVARIAGDCNWGIDDGPASYDGPACRVVWVRLDWSAES